MKRMKTFLIYALIIIGFFAFSMFLENGLLKAMYKDISGNVSGDYEGTDNAFGIENVTAQSSKTNGNVQFDLVNNSGKMVDEGYLKVDLYNSQNQNALTHYIPISGLAENESKPYNLKFKADNIKGYDISVIKDLPDKTNIIDIMGWEIDMSDVFGYDLTNATIFGYKITDLFSPYGPFSNGVSGALSNGVSGGINWLKGWWTWYTVSASNVPAWGYLLAWIFIVGAL